MTTTHALIFDESLAERHPGLTPPIAGALAEAARVCLDRHHTPPVVFSIDRGENSCAGVFAWVAADPRTQRAWANKTDTTEAGAYCLALVALELTDGLVAVGRAEALTGADYYLGKAGEIADDLENSHRLEVSGIDEGTIGAANTRLGQKVRQAKAGKSNLPAIVAVVCFSAKAIVTADVAE